MYSWHVELPSTVAVRALSWFVEWVGICSCCCMLRWKPARFWSGRR